MWHIREVASLSIHTMRMLSNGHNISPAQSYGPMFLRTVPFVSRPFFTPGRVSELWYSITWVRPGFCTTPCGCDGDRSNVHIQKCNYGDRHPERENMFQELQSYLHPNFEHLLSGSEGIHLDFRRIPSFVLKGRHRKSGPDLPISSLQRCR